MSYVSRSALACVILLSAWHMTPDRANAESIHRTSESGKCIHCPHRCADCGGCKCHWCQAHSHLAHAWQQKTDPQAVHKFARPSNTRLYSGGYVGGGTHLHGQPRYPNEGTWGWDYAPLALPRLVWLKWSHGRYYQGGSGAYKSDGPPLKLHK